MSPRGKALVAQGGGPTAVINQNLAGVLREARKFPEITKAYGVLNEDFLAPPVPALIRLSSCGHWSQISGDRGRD
jgi:hypothetical protein